MKKIVFLRTGMMFGKAIKCTYCGEKNFPSLPSLADYHFHGVSTRYNRHRAEPVLHCGSTNCRARALHSCTHWVVQISSSSSIMEFDDDDQWEVRLWFNFDQYILYSHRRDVFVINYATPASNFPCFCTIVPFHGSSL